MSLSVISLNLTAIFLLISAFLVFFSWKKEKSIFLRDFLVFLFGIAGASACWAIASWLVPVNPKIAGYFHPLAAVIGGIGFIYFCHLVLVLSFPERVKQILTPLILLFLATIPIILFYPPIPYLSEQGIIIWNINFLPGLTLAITGIIFTFLPLILFFRLGIKSDEKFVKIRSFLITIGIAFYMGGGLAHNLVTSVKQYLFSDALTFLGVIILLSAIYLKSFLKEKMV